MWMSIVEMIGLIAFSFYHSYLITLFTVTVVLFMNFIFIVFFSLILFLTLIDSTVIRHFNYFYYLWF